MSRVGGGCCCVRSGLVTLTPKLIELLLCPASLSIQPRNETLDIIAIRHQAATALGFDRLVGEQCSLLFQLDGLLLDLFVALLDTKRQIFDTINAHFLPFDWTRAHILYHEEYYLVKLYIFVFIPEIKSRKSAARSNSRLALARFICAVRSFTRFLYSSLGIFRRSSFG